MIKASQHRLTMLGPIGAIGLKIFPEKNRRNPTGVRRTTVVVRRAPVQLKNFG